MIVNRTDFYGRNEFEFSEKARVNCDDKVFRPKTGGLNLRDGTITTGGTNSVGTTWQRERKLVTISWYTETYF